MADEESPSDQKTDAVSARRQKEAWEQGRIPLGKDAAGVAGMMVGLLALMAVAPRLAQSLVALTRASLSLSADAPMAALLRAALEPAALGAATLGAIALAALAVTVAQTRGGLWTHLALPDFERLSGGRLLHAFSRDFLLDLALMAVKVGAVTWVAFGAVGPDVRGLPRLLLLGPAAQLAAVFEPLTRLAVRAVAVLAAFAGAELALSQWRFRQKMKMTREEAKREQREEEGDPLFRGRRRKRARELAKGRIAVEVPKADAVVVNPTHIAVAIRYRKGEGAAPRVIAKGKGQLAENIRELARAHGIPIVEDIALARLLYKRVKVGRSIPAETYRAVAAVLAFVYRVTGRVPQRGAAP